VLDGTDDVEVGHVKSIRIAWDVREEEEKRKNTQYDMNDVHSKTKY
jgi:hypothetical protein